LVPGALPLAIEFRPVGGEAGAVGAGAEPTGARGPMVHEGQAQGEKPRKETSAKEVGVGPGCGAQAHGRPGTYPYGFIQKKSEKECLTI